MFVAPPAHASTILARSGLSKSTIGRIWRKFDLKPHLTGTFKLSADPFFVEKVVDVVGLYHNPPERAVVLCVDEKSQIQALDRSQPVLPMMPGMPQHIDHLLHKQRISGQLESVLQVRLEVELAPDPPDGRFRQPGPGGHRGA